LSTAPRTSISSMVAGSDRTANSENAPPIKGEAYEPRIAGHVDRTSGLARTFSFYRALLSTQSCGSDRSNPIARRPGRREGQCRQAKAGTDRRGGEKGKRTCCDRRGADHRTRDRGSQRAAYIASAVWGGWPPTSTVRRWLLQGRSRYPASEGIRKERWQELLPDR